MSLHTHCPLGITQHEPILILLKTDRKYELKV